MISCLECDGRFPEAAGDFTAALRRGALDWLILPVLISDLVSIGCVSSESRSNWLTESSDMLNRNIDFKNIC